MMNYNDKLNIPGLESDTPSIIKYITDNYPEYLKANSFVTIDFIKLVNKAQAMVDGFDGDEDEYDNSFLNITDKNAQGILTNLSKDAISNPLSPYTINKIQEELSSISEKELFELFSELEKGNLHAQCNDSDEYNNRGNRRSSSGLIEDALADYSKAILLDPEDYMPIWNKALMFMENNMEGLASQDALLIYKSMITENNLHRFVSFLNLSKMFMNLNMRYYAISTLLKCLKDFNKYQVPFITENNGHSIDIDIKEKGWNVHVDLNWFNEIISIVKELDLENDKDPKLSPLIEDTKSEIVSTRVAIGF